MITNKYNRSIISILIYLIVFAIAFINEYLQYYYQQGYDLVSHLNRIMPIINGTYFIPHPLFHYSIYGLYYIFHIPFPSITMGEIAIVFLSLCVTLIFHLTYRCLHYFLNKTISNNLLLLYAFSLIMVMAIYAPFFNPYFYFGQWGPNMWHSPTMFVLKPLVIISAILMSIFLSNGQLANKKQYILLSGCLMLSAFAKPSFVFSFFPAICIFILLYHTRNFKIYKQSFLIVLPTLLVLVWQYFSTYFFDIASTTDLKDKIIFTFFGVTKIYSHNVLLSLLLATAFPLIVCLIDIKAFLKNKILILMWLNTFIAYLQSSFLAEEFKFDQAAFSFGYSISLTLLFIFSLIHFLQFTIKEKDIFCKRRNKIIVWTIYSLHLISGIGYYCANVFYNNYQ